MTPKNLLTLAEHKLCITEFFTPNDPIIEVNIMRVNAAAGFAIISSDKQIDSKTISARFFANNSIYVVEFTIDSELAVGGQYCIQLPTTAKEKKKGIVVNSYGGININTPIPSLRFSTEDPDLPTVSLSYNCHVIGDSFIIVHNDGEHSLLNLQDCINEGRNLEIITREKDNQELIINAVTKVSNNFIKVEVEGIKNLKSIANYFSNEIEEALTTATLNKKHIIESLHD
ncbi:hypothetical protein OTK49_21635 [Vibrio coralliirubri]|nr:hypothetical protein [Vibrio coralliirubri]